MLKGQKKNLLRYIGVVVQLKPLDVITLEQRVTDYINRMVTISK
jgi:hypothetical protein